MPLSSPFLARITISPSYRSRCQTSSETVIGCVRPLERLKLKQVMIHQLPLVGPKLHHVWRRTRQGVPTSERRAIDKGLGLDVVGGEIRRSTLPGGDVYRHGAAKGGTRTALNAVDDTPPRPFSPRNSGGGPSGFQQTR